MFITALSKLLAERGASSNAAAHRPLASLIPPGSLLLPFCVLDFCLKWVKPCKTRALGTGAAVAMKFGVLWSNTTVVSGLQAAVAGDSLLVSPSVRERTLHSLSAKQNKAMRMNVRRASFNIEGSVFVRTTCGSKEGSKGA